MDYGITQELTTDDERLWDRLSYKRVRQIINTQGVRVVGYSTSTNSYGTFKFITVDFKNSKERITFYGLGFHEYKDRYMWSTFKFYTSYKHEEDLEKVYNKKEILNKLEFEFQNLKEEACSHKQGDEGRDFETISELSDEDAALSMLY